jgi:hypothetical protein
MGRQSFSPSPKCNTEKATCSRNGIGTQSHHANSHVRNHNLDNDDDDGDNGDDGDRCGEEKRQPTKRRRSRQVQGNESSLT